MSDSYAHRTSQQAMTVMRWCILAFAVFLFVLSLHLITQSRLSVPLYVVFLSFAVSVVSALAFFRKRMWESTCLFYADAAGLYFPPPHNPWASDKPDETLRSQWLLVRWNDVYDVFYEKNSDRDGSVFESIVFSLKVSESDIKKFWVNEYSNFKLSSAMSLPQKHFANGCWLARYANGVFENGVPSLVVRLKKMKHSAI